MQDKLRIGRKGSLDLRAADAFFNGFDKAVIELCSRLVHNCL
jgi:hypothetical protein